jgi:hypothetical protein
MQTVSKTHPITRLEGTQQNRYASVPNLTLGARWGWVVKNKLWPLCLRERAPAPIVEETSWAPELVWMDMEERTYIFPIGVRTPGRPVRSQSLYQSR